MSNKMYEEESVKAIAEAIRLKDDGNVNTYTIGTMSDAFLRSPFKNVPAYHYAEAGRVTKKLLELKETHPNSISFGTISDNHVDSTDEKSMTSARHALFALEYVGVLAQCDFVANLGDNCAGTNIDNDTEYRNSVYLEQCSRYALTSQEGYSLVGNHDKSNSTQKLYNLMGKFNTFDDYGTVKIRGFGYRDYTDKKVRVICLNTCDYWNGQGGNGMSYEQKEWLMRSLDLSGKVDYTDWTILILSHIPLDFLGGDYNKGTDLKKILKAYNDGTTATITIDSGYAKAQNESDKYDGTLTYNYTGKNNPKVINIHGHIHNNATGKLVFIDDNSELDMVRVSTANSSFSGNATTDRHTAYGNYSITAEEGEKIKKVSGTKADTSATFYLIDLDEQVIYCVGYGADIDRTVPYKDANVYSIIYNLIDVISSSNSNSAVEGGEYSTVLTVETDYVLESVIVTMAGLDITADSYSNGVVKIKKIIGDIVITAKAKDNYVPKWDIANRTQVAIRAGASDVKGISRKNYYVGASSNGALHGVGYVTEVSLDGNDVTFATTSKDIGIGLPYHLEAGATYTFSAKASANARLRYGLLNADGTGGEESSYSSSGTDLTLTFTAPTDETKWVMLILDTNSVGTSITYSNITLNKN